MFDINYSREIRESPRKKDRRITGFSFRVFSRVSRAELILNFIRLLDPVLKNLLRFFAKQSFHAQLPLIIRLRELAVEKLIIESGRRSVVPRRGEKDWCRPRT